VGLFEGALLCFEVEMVLTEDVKDSYYDLMMLFFSLTAIRMRRSQAPCSKGTEPNATWNDLLQSYWQSD